MDNKLTQYTTDLIQKDFGLELGDQTVDEENLLALLSDAVAHMIEYRLDFLLSLLYRLDVDEKKINMALSPLSGEPANVALARLILDRQKQRMHTKKHYGSVPPEDLEGLEF